MASSAAQLDVNLSRTEGITVISFHGRLDVAEIVHARDQLKGATDGDIQRIVIDLSALEWIDSSGVGVLVSLSRSARGSGGNAVVSGLHGQPQEIFRLLRLNLAFDIFDDVEAAAQSLAAG